MLSLSPSFSTKPSGSYSSERCTEVWPPPTSSKVTAPALVAPSVAAHATFRSGTCSKTLASHPSTADAGNLGDPLQAIVVQLLHALHAAHELGEVLELRPLVVGRAHRHVHQDRLLDLRRH